MRAARILAMTFLAALVPLIPVARAALDPATWVTDGQVAALLAEGGTLYVGGRFERLGPVTGSGVPISTGTLQVMPGFPRIVGTVSAVSPDGAGGWYVGGAFTYVGGLARQNLAHITSAMTVDAWNPGTDGEVLAIDVTPTDVIVGGLFNTVNALARPRLARVSRSTGVPATWAPTPNDRVTALASDGTTLYAAGWFSQVGVTARAGLAAFTLATDALTSWDPAATSISPQVQLNDLALANGYVYVAGNFNTIGGQSRATVAALRHGSATATAWAPSSFGPSRLLPIGDRVIFGAGGTGSSGGLAAVDTATGAVFPNWTPNMTGVHVSAPNNTIKTIGALEALGSRIAVGGLFAGVSGLPRFCFAVIDTAAGAAASVTPMPTREVRALARQGDVLYVGGLFTSLGASERRNLAAFDVASGALSPWSPNAASAQSEPFGGRGAVNALTADPTRVFAVVTFTDPFNGFPRSQVRAFDRASAGMAWQRDCDQVVSALAHRAGVVFAGGSFSFLGGAKTNLAALDAATGTLQSWSPAPTGAVRALLATDAALVVGGEFANIGGQPRARLAQVDYTTAAATGWDPSADGTVWALARHGSTLYAGGDFANAGGQPRARVLALDLGASTALEWNPGAGASVRALATDGVNVFAGGDFLTFAGQPAMRFAGVPAVGGSPIAWGVGTNAGVLALALANSHVYLGGNFSNLVTEPNSGLASIFDPALLAVPPLAGPASVALAVGPSPMRGSGHVRFTVERDAVVTLRVLDVAGRSVRTLLARESRRAGQHQVPLGTAGLAPGLYHVQLRSGETESVTRFVLLP